MRKELVKKWIESVRNKYYIEIDTIEFDINNITGLKSFDNNLRAEVLEYILKTQVKKINFNNFFNQSGQLDLVKLDNYLHDNLSYIKDVYKLSGFDKLKLILNKNDFKIFSKYFYANKL